MRTLSLVGTSLLMAVTTMGCRPMLPSLPQSRNEMAKALDHLQWYTDAYGFGAMSMPLFVNPDEMFHFRLSGVSANTFFDAARKEINVRHAGAGMSLLNLGTSLTGQFDIAAIQQGLAAQSNYQAEVATVQEKRRLLDDAARREYEADRQAAQAVTDPVEREKKLAEADRKLAASLSGPAADASPKPSVTSGATADTAKSTSTSSQQLAFPQSLMAASSASPSNEMRSALLMAAGDTATYAILSLLGEPEKMSKFTGQKVLFGVSTVSVNPGWLTTQNFAADVSTKVSITYVPAREEIRDALIKHLDTMVKPSTDKSPDKIPDKRIDRSQTTEKEPAANSSNAFAQLSQCITESLQVAIPNVSSWCDDFEFEPEKTLEQIPERYQQELLNRYILRSCKPSEVLVSAVSPMSDAQLLDSQSSLSRQVELSARIQLALSYAGAKAAADTFGQWAKRQQEDIQSRSANVVVNSYSMSGGIFGFQVGPKLLASPSQSSGSASVEKLTRQSFPTLLIMGYDEQEVGARVLIYKHETTKKTYCHVVEPDLRLDTMTSWKPLNKKADVLSEKEFYAVRHQARDAWRGLMASDRRRLRERESERASESERGSGLIASADPMKLYTDRQHYHKHLEQLLSRLEGVGYHTTLPIEALKAQLAKKDACAKCEAPKITAVSPDVIWLGRDQAGKPMSKTVQIVLVGTGLDKVNEAQIEQGSAFGFNSEGKESTEKLVIKKVGGSRLLTLRVDAADSPLVLTLPVKDPDVVIRLPAIKVAMEPAPSTPLKIEHTKPSGTESFSFPKGTSDDVIKAVVQKDAPVRAAPASGQPDRKPIQQPLKPGQATQ